MKQTRATRRGRRERGQCRQGKIEAEKERPLTCVVPNGALPPEAKKWLITTRVWRVMALRPTD